MAVFPAIPYGVDLIGGPRLETRQGVIAAFRPGEAAPVVSLASERRRGDEGVRDAGRAS